MAWKHPLVAFREANKLNQTEAANLVGITQSMWSLLEKGGVVRPETAKRIADITGVQLEILLGLAVTEDPRDNESVADAGASPKLLTK